VEPTSWPRISREETQQKDGDWNRDRDETVQHSQSELIGKNIPEKSKAQRQWFGELLE